MAGRQPGDEALAREQAASSRAGAAARGRGRALAQEFGAFVRAYEAKIYNVIYRLVDDPREAEDLTQDTFVSAYRAYHRFRGDASVYTWLYRIAVNRTKNRLKQMARQRAAEAVSLDSPLDVGDEVLEREVEDWTNAPERVLESQELGQYVEKCIAALQPDFRSVVVLRHYEGLPYDEIAKIEGCTVKAVKSRLFRARSILRDRIARYQRQADL
ncbi:MAG: sigma-70 family RNA polymerase sigma factor [Armatimonadota bacterium]